MIRKEQEARKARGTNHEPGSGSAFINYCLSLNTICGTFVRDLSHTRMQHVRDRDSNGILAIISHPFDTYHAYSQSHVYVRASTYSLAFGLIAGIASVRYGGSDINTHTHIHIHICASHENFRNRFPFRSNHFMGISCRDQKRLEKR